MTSDQIERDAPKPRLVIRARRGWLPVDPRELWEFRELLRRFAARDITLRYRQTALGVTWVILQPLLGAGVLSFVFGGVAKLPSPAGIPYFVFSLVGMVGWIAFSQTALRGSSSLVANAPLVQKVFFPRLLLPLSTTLSTLVDVGVATGLLGVLLVVNRIWAGLPILTVPVWMALLTAAGMGIGLMSSAVMVRYRDVQYVIPVAMQLLLFASPVAYAASAAPASAQWAFAINPLTGLLEGLRWSYLGTPAPSLPSVMYSAGVAVALLAIGMLVFNSMDRQFADVI